MGPEAAEFFLRWNNHHNVLVSILDSLLERERLVDVTLAAEGQFINVHRLVLFACSQYFEDLLSQLPDKPAVVFLKDVRFSDLRALVDYMYKGEVNVAQDQLANFLTTAESLKIKGLVYKEKDQNCESSPPEPLGSQQGKGKVARLNLATGPPSPPIDPLPVPVDSINFLPIPPQVSACSSQGAPTSQHHVQRTNSPVIAEHSEIVNGDHFIPVNPKHEDTMEEPDVALLDDHFEATEHWDAQQAEGDSWNSSKNQLSTAHTSLEHSVADHLDTENEACNPDDSANANPGPSRVKRKRSTSGISSSRGAVPVNKDRQKSWIVKCSCGRGYQHQTTYVRHKMFECGKKATFACVYQNCQSRFKRKDTLKVHLIRTHGDSG